MHKLNWRKTFSKILLVIHEPNTSIDAADYAIKIAQDYDAQLVILHVIRTDVNLLSVNPSHIMEVRRQTKDHFNKIAEKIHEDSNKENILRMKTEIITSVRIADEIGRAHV